MFMTSYNSAVLAFGSTMRVHQPSDVTQLLVDWQGGDELALNKLMPIVYRELRKVAARYLRDERSAHTLEPTELIHESYLRMVKQSMPQWQNRAHFYGVAARLMRQILVDHAREKGSAKRGGEQTRVAIDQATPSALWDAERVLIIDAALNKLSELDERKSRALEMRVFGGMKLSDIAVALDVSEPTIKRDMRMVKAWLRVEIGD
jgi:RNA polymerase sigma factor (TIGR02999 family)